MKKSDCILIAAILAAAALAYCLSRQNSINTIRMSIFVDGALVRSESLSENAAPVIIENSYGRNIVKIESDGVTMIWSDCPSQTCVHTGKIMRRGEVIACLPHRLLITLDGGESQPEEIDVIAK